MEREVGGGIGMGKTCKLKDVSFQCMTKFHYKKKKKEKKIYFEHLTFPFIFICADFPIWIFFFFFRFSTQHHPQIQLLYISILILGVTKK